MKSIDNKRATIGENEPLAKSERQSQFGCVMTIAILTLGIGFTISVIAGKYLRHRHLAQVPHTQKQYTEALLAKINAERARQNVPAQTLEEYVVMQKRIAATMFIDALYEVGPVSDERSEGARIRLLRSLTSTTATSKLSEYLAKDQNTSRAWRGARRSLDHGPVLDLREPNVLHLSFVDEITGTGKTSGRRRLLDADVTLTPCPEATADDESTAMFIRCMVFGFQIAEFSVREDN